MGTTGDAGDPPLPPDDAFAVLGNETRMAILQELAESDDPLPFSELRDRVGVKDSGQFNYHLDKLAGHFVESTNDGYDLRRAGERIIEAVVSGAVTESPVIEPTEIDWPCGLCGAPVVVSYQQEWLAFSCTECPGLYGGSVIEDENAPDEQLETGYLGGLNLPPAAVQGRDAADVVRTAFTWDFLERIATSHEICPRCSAQVERTVNICEDHDAGDGLCETCGSRDRAMHTISCPNCHNISLGILPAGVHGYTEVLDFLTSLGFNPVSPTPDQFRTMSDATEVDVISTEPIEVRITYSLEGKTLELTLDEEMRIIEATGLVNSEIT